MYEGSFWSLYEPAIPTVFGALRAYRDAITAGPADDAQRQGLPVQVVNGAAIVPMVGPMLRRVHPLLAALFGLTSTDAVRAAIQAADSDDDVQAIILRVDSPGGSVSGTHELAQAVAATTKPVTVVGEGMIASAAMWVASQADRIIVGPSDLVGSIGVRMLMYDESKAFEEAGIEPVAIDTGEFKSAGAPGLPITDAQRADFQRIVDFYFGQFTGALAQGRKMDRESVAAVADGRMFTPTEAKKSGLIDGVGDLAGVLNSMRGRKRSTDAARARIRM